jgi:hypothetical protein
MIKKDHLPKTKKWSNKSASSFALFTQPGLFAKQQLPTTHFETIGRQSRDFVPPAGAYSSQKKVLN